MKRTTLKELAYILGLAPSTISKSLNGSSEISAFTRNRVREMARVCGYIPNNMARCLKLKKTGNIGVILPNVEDEFFAKVLQGIEIESKRLNYNLIFGISGDTEHKEAVCLTSFLGGMVDGVILSLAQETQKRGNYKHFEILKDYDIPLVLFDRTSEKIPCDQITIDDFDGGYSATQYLLATGCRSIAFLSSINHTSVGELRKEGYLSALFLESGACSPILLNIDRPGQIKSRLQQAIDQYNIDGLIIANGPTAIITMNILQRMGYHVPSDISVIGYADIAMGEFSNPPLTTIAQHAERMGMTAFNVLLNRLINPGIHAYSQTVVKSRLVVRESTKAMGD